MQKIIPIIIAIGIIATLGIGVSKNVSADTLTIQPSSKDASLLTNTTNYGGSETLWLEDTSNTLRHNIFEFDLSVLPAGAVLNSATLSLYYYFYYYTNPAGKTAWMYKQPHTNWVELEATGYVYKTGSPWATPFGDYSSPGVSAVFPAAYGWMNWNVSAIVQDAYNNSNPAEFLMRFENEAVPSGSGNSRVYFYSNNYISTLTRRPKLTIEYTISGGSPPLAPQNVVATHGTNTAYVTVNWTASANATNYRVWRDGTDLGLVGNVVAYRDKGAAPPTITAGTVTASDLTLSVAGQSANNGNTHTYKVQAYNSAGYSADSVSVTGYRGFSVWTADPGENQNYHSVYLNGYIYASCYGCSPAKVFKVNAATLEQVGTWTAPPGQNRAINIVGSGNYVYIGIHGDASSSIIPTYFKINTQTMLDEAKYTGLTGQMYGRNIAMDENYIYGLSEYAGAGVWNIDKLNIADMSSAGGWRGNGEDFVGLAVDDTYVYALIKFARIVDPEPFKLYIIKKSDMSLVHTYTGASDQKIGRTVFVDGDNIFVTLGNTNLDGTVVKIIKIAKSTWTQVGIPYEGEADEINAAQTASDGNFLYSTLGVSPGKIIKVDYATMKKVGAYIAPSVLFSLGAGVDLGNGKLYAVFNTSPARLKVIDPNTMTDLSYQWQQSATNSPTSPYSDIPGAQTPTYTVTDGARYYKCVVSATAAASKTTPAVFAEVTTSYVLNAIYYNSGQETDPYNNFLGQAANELKNNLADIGENLAIVTASKPTSGSIYLEVNAAHPDLAGKSDEAFKLYSDNKGIYIIGKTPLAVRHGAYALLEKFGFRWFFANSAWWVKPSSLISLVGLNEVQDPLFFWRNIYIWTRVPGNNIGDWMARNRLLGVKDYTHDENYYKIAALNNYDGHGSLASMYYAHPDWFLPTGHTPSGTVQWELRPDNLNVVAMAKSYAQSLLSAIPHWLNFGKDRLSYGAIPITPNDDSAWDPPWNPSTDWQTITDKVYYLANEVAKNIQTSSPGTYVSILCVSSYAGIPTIALEKNIIAELVTDFNATTVTIYDWIAGLKAKGVQVGIYDFYSEWVYFQDLPFLNLGRVQEIKNYAQRGVKSYHAQAGGNAWGAMGLTSYAASKMLWDPFQDFNAILQDFYSKAFGPASEIMKRYYGRYEDSGNNQSFDYQKSLGLLPPADFANTVLASFRDLDEAESAVAGNSVYLARIRQLEYYQRFLWFYHVRELANLGIDELKTFYTFINKIRDLHVIHYTEDEPVVRAELKNRGLTDLAINALQNFTPPTIAEASAWLNEALAAFPQNSYTVDVQVRASSDDGHTFGTSLTAAQTYSLAGKVATTNYNSFYRFTGITIPQFSTIKEAYLSLYESDSSGVPSTIIYADDQNNPGAVTSAADYNNRTQTTVGVGANGDPGGYGWHNITITPLIKELVDSYDYSNEAIQILHKENGSAFSNYRISKTWDDSTHVYGARLYIEYEPPTVPPPPSAFTISDTDKLYLFRDKANTFQILGGNFNLATSFNVQFIQGATTVSSFTVQPTNTSIINLNLTSAQINTLPIGFYDLKMVRTADNISQTYNKQILVTILGDIWSRTATESAEQKRDGKVNLYDFSRMFSKWKSIVAADLQECDINAGPGNISQGKIDLYDANRLMTNWLP
ncbi:MAG: DUF4838 domain-containing protein [Candidatus Nealsonbacteria bacterium]